MPRTCFVGIGLVVLIASGCASQPPRDAFDTAQPASAPQVESPFAEPRQFLDVEATCVPPIGWTAEPLRQGKSHVHRTWASPTRNTAYGIIRFNLPFPVGSDLATRGFVRALRSSEGDAKLISKQRDTKLPGTRSLVVGGPYVLRNNVVTRGWHGWVVYACTMRGRPIAEDELTLAERAREETVLGPSDDTESDAQRTEN